jgi:large subunit ribosomal protein L21
MRAVVRFRGEQYTVTPGQKLTLNRLDMEPGASVVFDEVLLVSSNQEGQSTVLVGAPLVAGAKVTAKVLDHDKGKKVLIFKKKRRKGYTKFQGHRQLQSELLIEEIVATRSPS